KFRLVDQLYDNEPIVAGPNGINMTLVYEQLLDNFLLKFVNNGLPKQQDQIRRFLLKDVPTTTWIEDTMEHQNERERTLARNISASMGAAGALIPSVSISNAGMMFDISNKSTVNGEMLNRIELSELLMNEYLYAKQDWELERDGLINQATESQRALNAVTRQLAHITATRQAQLASKYSDAVVRGYSHSIRQYMGYMDIASPAEALQDAKDALREAAMSSLDGSMNVYPVQLLPIDWAKGLSTSFTMEDLTQDPDLVLSQI
ncbi:hypothetical protein B0H13DRAFT_1539245, partial [Mycena leptocephala]